MPDSWDNSSGMNGIAKYSSMVGRGVCICLQHINAVGNIFMSISWYNTLINTNSMHTLIPQMHPEC